MRMFGFTMDLVELRKESFIPGLFLDEAYRLMRKINEVFQVIN